MTSNCKNLLNNLKILDITQKQKLLKITSLTNSPHIFVIAKIDFSSLNRKASVSITQSNSKCSRIREKKKTCRSNRTKHAVN